MKDERKSILRWLLPAGLMLLMLALAGCGECLHIHMDKQQFTPDCDSAGYTLERCRDCGVEHRIDMVSPTGHDLIENITAPTCGSEGYTTYTCNNCDYTYRSDAVAPLAHDMTATVTSATCTGEGYTTYACRACDYAYRSDLTAPLDHELTETVTPATCTQAGRVTLACRYCAYTRTQQLPVIEHNYRTTILEPDCDRVGHTTYICTDCGYSYIGAYTGPLGHDFEKEVVGPTTCLTTGYTRYTCTVCAHSYIGDTVFYSDVFPGAYGVSDAPLWSGVDVSKYNHKVDGNGQYLPLDFNAIAAAGYKFVILKIGSTPRVGADGVTRGGIEPTFEADFAAARAAGLDIGVYFYTYSTTPEGAAADARLVMDWLGERKLEYPIYFDVEDRAIEALGRRGATDLCLSFISTLQAERYYGALYTNNRWLTTLLQTDKVTFLFDIWYARYPAGDGPFVWNEEKYGPGVGMWQYSQTGKIPGLPVEISFDLNYAYRDYPALIREMGYNGYAVAPIDTE